MRRVSFVAVALGAAVVLPRLLRAAATGGAGDDVVVRLFLVLAVMLAVGAAVGVLFRRIGQPPVLGELIAGMFLGSSMLGVIPADVGDPVTGIIRVLAEIGVVVLLFQIGLETDIGQLFRVGRAATTVAVVGVATPMTLGILFWLSPLARHEFGHGNVMTTAILLGATLTATSVGITARVLKDLRVMGSVESRLIVGAAVIDDVIGLVLLGLVASLVAGREPSVLEISRSVGAAIGFLVLAVGVGLVVMRRVFVLIDRLFVGGVLLVAAFAFALALAALASIVGSAMIIGAFAAGMVLAGGNQFDAITERIRPVADIFTPIFFLSIGSQFNVRLLSPLSAENRSVLLLGLLITLIAAAGKIVAGWSVWSRKFNRPAVGFGMLPRGEVGLIFANMGLMAGVLTTELFSAIILMVIATTFAAPPLLKWSFAKWGVTEPEEPKPSRLSRRLRRLGALPEEEEVFTEPEGEAHAT
ncbi:MAG TPA: cation:proton antiporter [Gemmatimonadales bacterium]|jgi:Kef-type K+ transport system membrane component KefB